MADDNVCQLRWGWERVVPQPKRSVFVIPAKAFKGKRPHVLVLYDVAWKIVESCRGVAEELVFVWRRQRVNNVDEEPVMPYRPVHTMNNTALQNGRRKAGPIGFVCTTCAAPSARACAMPECRGKTGPCCRGTP